MSAAEDQPLPPPESSLPLAANHSQYQNLLQEFEEIEKESETLTKMEKHE